MLACGWAEWSLYAAIRRQAGNDEARPADAIVIFGAAEYNGAPSPVFKARLDRAQELDDRGLAPVLITTGGSGGDISVSEDYVTYYPDGSAETASIVLQNDKGEVYTAAYAATTGMVKIYPYEITN